MSRLDARIFATEPEEDIQGRLADLEQEIAALRRNGGAGGGTVVQQIIGGSVLDATATIKGVSRLSVPPANSADPIATGDNDPRLELAPLKDPTTVGATTVTLKSPAALMTMASLGFIVIDAGTADAEIRKVTAISGSTLTVAALTRAHAADDRVVYVDGSFFSVALWGLKGDGNESFDCEPTITKAAAELGPIGGGTLFFPLGVYIVWRLVWIKTSNTRLLGAGKGSIIRMVSDANDPSANSKVVTAAAWVGNNQGGTTGTTDCDFTVGASHGYTVDATKTVRVRGTRVTTADTHVCYYNYYYGVVVDAAPGGDATKVRVRFTGTFSNPGALVTNGRMSYIAGQHPNIFIGGRYPSGTVYDSTGVRDVTIQDLTLDGNDENRARLSNILVAHAPSDTTKRNQRITFRNVYFTNNYDGPWIYTTEGVTFEGCELDRMKRGGFTVLGGHLNTQTVDQYTADLKVVGCTLSDYCDNAVNFTASLWTAGAVHAFDCTIAGNVFLPTTPNTDYEYNGNCVHLNGVKRASVTGNVMFGPATGGVWVSQVWGLYSEDVTIAGNVITDCGRDSVNRTGAFKRSVGISLDAAWPNTSQNYTGYNGGIRRVTITGNVIDNPNGHAIQVKMWAPAGSALGLNVKIQDVTIANNIIRHGLIGENAGIDNLAVAQINGINVVNASFFANGLSTGDNIENLTIVGNTIRQPRDQGIYAKGYGAAERGIIDLNVSHNMIIDPGSRARTTYDANDRDHAIHVEDVIDAQYHGNVVRETGASGSPDTRCAKGLLWLVRPVGTLTVVANDDKDGTFGDKISIDTCAGVARLSIRDNLIWRPLAGTLSIASGGWVPAGHGGYFKLASYVYASGTAGLDLLPGLPGPLTPRVNATAAPGTAYAFVATLTAQSQTGFTIQLWTPDATRGATQQAVTINWAAELPA